MSEITSAPEAKDDVRLRAEEMGEALRSGLSPLLREIAGARVRPSRLVELLGIDKSLASRVARSLRSESPMELLHFIPSPSGLRILLDAAARVGVEPQGLEHARKAVDRFQGMIESLPGGRASLDAYLSETLVEVRRRSERAATQAVYRGMSYMLGFQCDAISSALILQPGEDGLVDGIEVSVRSGIRRLRPSAPVALFSINLAWEENPGKPRLEPLHREADPGDPMAFLHSRFCSPQSPPVELHRAGDHVIFALPETVDSVQRPVTVASAFRIRNGWIRYRTGDRDWESRTYLLHYPCKVLVRDLYLREDLYFGSEPRVRFEFPSPTGIGQTPYLDRMSRMNELDMVVAVEYLRRGGRASGVDGIPIHGPLVADAFEAGGLDPAQFRGYRVRLVYPVPMIGMGWWIQLLH